MEPQELSELWKIARAYGRVQLATMADGTYHACIEFDSIEHTKLEAKSSFDCRTAEEAMRMAIVSARKIVDSIHKMARILPEPKLIT